MTSQKYIKIITVVGARPQFIKASAVSRAIQSVNKSGAGLIDEVLVHTGQHYDSNMSAIFFSELEICEPKYNLDISQCSHGEMTGKMLIALEEVLEAEKPNAVLVYGDTNSTLAAALAAVKLNIPVAHVESGLRSYNRRMPEEINRIIVDSVSTLLFCPTEEAVSNLESEGISKGVACVGDVMYDTTLYYQKQANSLVDLSKWKVEKGAYALCTIHRAENTDNTENLSSIVSALSIIAHSTPVVFPVHPRTKRKLEMLGKISDLQSLILVEPVSYLEMLALESSAKVIFTDSGGVQKEAYFQNVPCITLREETEWVETVDLGVNILCGADEQRILDAWNSVQTHKFNWAANPYGDGDSSTKVVQQLLNFEHDNI
jgi:UDP-GlcNAc3NAcA epimerase